MRSAHERYTTGVPPADSVARTQTQLPPCSLSTPRGAGLSPCTERHSAGHAKQRAARPRLPEEPLAQLSWASSPRTAGAVARRHLRPGMSVARASPSRCCRTFVAKQRGAPRQAASQRRGSGHHTPVVADASVRLHTGSVVKMPLTQIAQTWRRAEQAEPAPGSPRFGRASPPTPQGRGSCGRPRGGRSASPLHRIGLRLLLNLLNGDISAAWEATTGDAFSTVYF